MSHCIYIRRIDFLSLLEKFPLDNVRCNHFPTSPVCLPARQLTCHSQEIFCTLKDDLIMKEKDRFSYCESCKESGRHGIMKCDLLFAKLNKVQVIGKFNYSE